MAATHPGLRCASLTARVRDPGSDFLCTRQGTGPRCARLPSTPPDTKLAGPLRTLGSLGPQAPPGNQTLTERGGLNGSANHRHHLQFSKGRHGTWQYGSHLHRTDGLPAAPNNDCHAPPPAPPSAPVAELSRLPNAGPWRPLVCFAPLPAFLYLPSGPLVLIFI